MTDDLEDLVRRSLAAHADAAPAPDGLARGVQRRHRRTLVAAVTAAVVVIAGGGTGLGIALTRPPHEAYHGPIVGVPRAASTRTVAYHGIDVDVPKSWGTNDTHCGTAVRNTVILGEADGLLCGLVLRRPADFVEVTTINRTTPRGGINRRIGNFLGRDTIRRNPNHKQFEQILAVQALGVVVTVNTTKKELGNTIVGSVRTADVSPEGCPMRHHNLPIEPTHDPKTAEQQPGMTASLIPGMPTSVAACHYQKGWLVGSAKVSGVAAQRFARTIDRAPKNLGREPGMNCPPPVPVDGFQLTARYSSGPAITVNVTTVCGVDVASNGLRQGKLDVHLQQAISLVVIGGHL